LDREMSLSQPANLVRLVRTSGLCILRQLRLEEKLLRSPGAGNWCLLNDGTPDRSVVLGISGKPHQLVDVRRALDDGLRVIKRFSGGGTVIVDRDTQFVTLVMNAAAVPDLALFPRQIMDWTGSLYGGRPHGVFADVPGWQLRENDYVIGERKVGGNAQSISKDRWLHHTSFLWDFREETMKYLTNPAKQPRYRANRSHSDFLAPLKTYLPDRNALATRMEAALEGMGLEVAPASIEQAEDAVAAHHRGSGVGTTGVVDLETALTLGPDDRAPMLTGA
jgi:lipoate-protein ligase A